MPDSRTQRGPHPKDLRSFTPEALPVLRRAVDELSWLLSRNYSAKASLKLVGDRYLLRDRQRMAIQRCAASERACHQRLANRVEPEQIREQKLLIDGYNALLTVEAAMSGGVVLATRDGVFRDIASLSRHYRQVGTTEPALEAIGSFLEEHGCGPAPWLLDRPISNSGRLAKVIKSVAEERGWQWSVELVPNPDHPLQRTEEIVVTADSAILDRCRHWLNLARLVVERLVPEAWVIDLSTVDSARVAMSSPGPTP